MSRRGPPAEEHGRGWGEQSCSQDRERDKVWPWDEAGGGEVGGGGGKGA